MKLHLLPAVLLAAAVSYAQTPATTAAKVKTAAAAGKVHRTADGHPDLSGNWTFGIDLPHGDLQKIVNGKVTRTHYDQSARHHASNDVPGALPWEPAPSY
ncbi:MAG TPA: hypothetical protein VK687_14805, partial [Bryobacteraceae bacterium]|nr:hypothetical protein [Bryobacteraceae bacterium]